MNYLFYEEWYSNRVNKIVDILGKDWFAGKSILELGSCYGDIGISLLKLGAKVHFTDVREEHLTHITTRLAQYDITPETTILNQNYQYNFKRKYDLILHQGILYHIENWKQDLICALQHSNMMFLETLVTPQKGAPDQWLDAGPEGPYESHNCKVPLFTQESVEDVLMRLGCKFLRLDSNSLNTNITWGSGDALLRNVYDWNYNNVDMYDSDTEVLTRFRRMWLVIK